MEPGICSQSMGAWFEFLKSQLISGIITTLYESPFDLCMVIMFTESDSDMVVRLLLSFTSSQYSRNDCITELCLPIKSVTKSLNALRYGVFVLSRSSPSMKIICSTIS